MQIYPLRRISLIIRRLCCLSQPGHDAKRHFGSGAFSVQDCFVFCNSDCLRDHLNNPGREIQIVRCVLKKGIAHRDKSRHFISVHRNLVEHKGQLIDRAAHFCPDGFRHGPGYGLPCLSLNRSYSNSIDQFGVAVHIFGNQFQEYDRDFQVPSLDCPLCALQLSQSSKKLFYVFPLDDCLSRLHRKGVERPHVHGEFSNFLSCHFHTFPFFHGFGRLSLIRLWRLFF